MTNRSRGSGRLGELRIRWLSLERCGLRTCRRDDRHARGGPLRGAVAQLARGRPSRGAVIVPTSTRRTTSSWAILLSSFALTVACCMGRGTSHRTYCPVSAMAKPSCRILIVYIENWDGDEIVHRNKYYVALLRKGVEPIFKMFRILRRVKLVHVRTNFRSINFLPWKTLLTIPTYFNIIYLWMYLFAR